MRTEKITPTTINGIKTLIASNVKQGKIAEIYGVSLCTVQTVKRTGFNYNNYKKYTLNQFKKWRTRTAKQKASLINTGNNELSAAEKYQNKTNKASNGDIIIGDVERPSLAMYSSILNRLENIENILNKVFRI